MLPRVRDRRIIHDGTWGLTAFSPEVKHLPGGCAVARVGWLRPDRLADSSWYIRMTYDRNVNYLPDGKRDGPWWSFFWKILAGVSLIGRLAFWFAHGPLFNRVWREYSIV